MLTSTVEAGMLVWYGQDLLHPEAVAVFHPETVNGLAGLEVVATCCAPRLGLMKPTGGSQGRCAVLVVVKLLLLLLNYYY